MLNNIVNFLKYPVTTILEKQEKEDLKVGGIKLVALSFILPLLNVISTLITIFSKYTEKNYSYYSSYELAQAKSEAFENAKLVETFFTTWLTLAITIVVVAFVLYIIAKIIKSPKNYSATLSITNNSFILYVGASILSTIISLLYVPLGLLVLYTGTILAAFTLLYSFRDSLSIEDSNKLVLATTGVLIALIIVFIIVISFITDVSILYVLDEFTSLESLDF